MNEIRIKFNFKNMKYFYINTPSGDCNKKLPYSLKARLLFIKIVFIIAKKIDKVTENLSKSRDIKLTSRKKKNRYL